MDDQQAKAKLVEREAQLLSLLDPSNHSVVNVELDPSRVGRLSRMDALQGQAMAAESQRRRQSELSRVRSALARIDAGEWGDCLQCGEPIAARRLEHDPAAVTCIDCARGIG